MCYGFGVLRRYRVKGVIQVMNSQKLRGLIAERGLTQSKVAAAMGMSQKTFYSKMKSGQFGLDECEALIDILAISNPMEIFFPHLVS